MRTILVTGGTGFIGIHTCLCLIKKGYRVIIIDNLINSHYESINGLKKILEKEENNFVQFEFIKGDVRDKKFLTKIFQRFNKEGKSISSVIHFAGLKSVPYSIINPLDFWDNNFNGTLNLLKVMAKYECKNFVFSSSASVYGAKYNESLKESFLNSPINPYGETKNSIEKMLNNLYLSDNNWRIICLRYFNPIGAHSSGLIGENSVSKIDNLFPSICEVAAGVKKELKIYGNKFSTKDGTCVRDFVHVMDIAEGHIEAIKFLINSDGICTSINLGTGKKTTVLELIKIFEKINKIKINYSFGLKRRGDPEILLADVKKAKILINWTSKRSLEDMCLDGWRWYCSSINNSKK